MRVLPLNWVIAFVAAIILVTFASPQPEPLASVASTFPENTELENLKEEVAVDV